MDRNLQSLLNCVNEPTSTLCKMYAKQSLNDMREVLNDMQIFLTSGVDKGYFKVRENGDYGLDKDGLTLYVEQKIHQEDDEAVAAGTKLQVPLKQKNKISSKADVMPLKCDATWRHNSLPKISSFKTYHIKELPTIKRAKTSGKQKTSMLKRHPSMPILRVASKRY